MFSPLFALAVSTPRAQPQLRRHARALVYELVPGIRRAAVPCRSHLLSTSSVAQPDLHRLLGDPQVLRGDAVRGVADDQRDVRALGGAQRAQRGVVLEVLGHLRRAPQPGGVDQAPACAPRTRSSCRSRRASCRRCSETITRSKPRKRLTSEDLPTFGRPITASRIASVLELGVSAAQAPAGRRCGRAARRSRAPGPPRRASARPARGGGSRPRASLRGVSHLFAATSTGGERVRSRSASSSSPGRTPARASTTSTARSASASPARAWARIARASGSGSPRSMPPVSTSENALPFHSHATSLRSRVTPGARATTASRRAREAVDERGLADVRITDDRDLHGLLTIEPRRARGRARGRALVAREGEEASARSRRLAPAGDESAISTTSSTRSHRCVSSSNGVGGGAQRAVLAARVAGVAQRLLGEHDLLARRRGPRLAAARAPAALAVRKTLSSACGSDDGADVASLRDPIAVASSSRWRCHHARRARQGPRRRGRPSRRPPASGSRRSRRVRQQHALAELDLEAARRARASPAGALERATASPRSSTASATQLYIAPLSR